MAANSAATFNSEQMGHWHRRRRIGKRHQRRYHADRPRNHWNGACPNGLDRQRDRPARRGIGLLYAKGGAAWAGDEYSAFIPLFNEQSEATETRPGWTVGGGIERALLPSTSRVNVRQRNLSRQVRDQLSILSPQRLALAGRASRPPCRFCPQFLEGP